ncbi:GIY-YIG nuclease family protein [Metabacillus arenae]|uniref:GIY-YIG nuclease family protein n=1 Tax=Metabacillus arenae TaxID=2771434 RepID=A0A926RZM4_9BACI|nr:GIY-YIG nuclease family protein [Metabacillus arenae]MBD1379204.1 GIY-YIG nuclease family protein [Metabacillus arenae]
MTLSNIYLITNTINNKKYVGQSIDPIQRWKNHQKDSKKYLSRYLYRAMNKYGIENFKFEVIENDIPVDSIDDQEIYWINKFNTKSPYGYNMTDGGEGSVGRKMNDHTRQKLLESKKNPVSEETKEKMSNSHKLRWEDQELRKEYSKKLKGVPKSSNENYLKAWEEISLEDRVERLKPAAEACKVGVLMLNIIDESIEKEFDSMRDAVKWIRENANYPKAGHQNISKACKGKINYVYGYKWAYK